MRFYAYRRTEFDIKPDKLSGLETHIVTDAIITFPKEVIIL